MATVRELHSSDAVTRIIPPVLALLLAACSGVIGDAGAVEPVRPMDHFPTADECEAVDPYLALPMRRMDRDEYAAVYSALVGRDVSAELRGPDQLGTSGGMLRNDAAAGVTTAAVEAMLDDADVIAAALLSADVAPRFDVCVADDASRACAERFVIALAQRAFRRPIGTGELAALMSTYERELAAGSGEELLSTVRRVLLAPETFYRPELGDGAGELRRLTAHELASRLSFTLTGEPPSDALIAAATEGALDDAASRRTWAERLLFDGDRPTEVARAHLGRLFFDWLELGELQSIELEGDSDLAERWRDETMAFVEEVVFTRRGGTEMLLDGGFAMLDETLASTYGEPAVAGDTLRPVESDVRRGLLQQGSFLGATWAEERTAIHRGAYLVRRFFCSEFGPIPAAANDFVARETGSERERLAETDTNPSCASCHGTINPLGFAFGELGREGELRELDLFGEPILTAGEARWLGPVEGAQDVSARMAESEEVQACVSQWLFTFASGRRLERSEPADACQLRALTEQPSTLGQLLDYVGSDAFTHNRILAGETE
ncbi:MAG: DUF1592 domain-containing protein [Myxococcota bacterium]|nr:DUF1592 domain-containing protein [Myxococcota bacterium]